MKKILSIKLLLIVGSALISQQTGFSQTEGGKTEQTSPGASTNSASPDPPPPTKKYVYSYDSNGSRIKSYHHITVQALTKSTVLDTTYQEGEMILPNEVIFYPNPTTGFVNVTIQDFDQDLIWNARVSNTSGNQVCNSRITSPTFQFDLSAHKTGIYILRIQGGSLFNEWKIIKQ